MAHGDARKLITLVNKGNMSTEQIALEMELTVSQTLNILRQMQFLGLVKVVIPNQTSKD